MNDWDILIFVTLSIVNKMNNRCFVFVLQAFLLLLFSSCGKGGKETASSDSPIVVDLTDLKETNTPLKLSQFAESISYIRLSEDPLIGDIQQSPIRIIKDTFYLDSDNVYKYAPDGKFIKKLFKEGDGPGEARKYNFTRSAFNKKDRYFTFRSIALSFMSYSFDGEFLGKEDSAYVEGLGRKHIKDYFNDYQLYEYQLLGTAKKGKINLIGPHLFYAKHTQTGSIIYPYPNPAADEQAVDRHIGASLHPGDMQYMQIDSLLWVKHVAIDTLYATSGLQTFQPRYIFKTSNSFMDIRTYTHYKSVDMTREEAENKKIIYSVLPLPNGGLLYTTWEKTGFADSSGKTFGFSAKPIVNDLDTHLKTIDLGKILGGQTFSIDNGHLYMLAEGYRFFEDGCNPPFPNMTEESNPVIVKIKLK